MRSLALVASSLSLLFPAVALACGGPEGTYYEHYGSAVFAPGGEISALAPNHADVYDFVAIDADLLRTPRGSIDVMPAMESTGPRVRFGAGELFARIGADLFRVNESGRVTAPLLGGIASFDVARGAGPLVMVTGSWDALGASRLAIHGESRDVFGGLREIATAEAGTCDASKIAIGRFASGAVAGLCGDSPFRLDGDVISVEPSLGLGGLDSVEAAGLDADGALTFFAAAPSAESWQDSKIFAIRRTAEGAWSTELVATLPITQIADGRLAAAGAEAGVAAGWDEYSSLPMHSFRRIDGVWVTEIVAYVQPADRLAVRGDASSMDVLAGGYTLRSYDRDDEQGTWSETSLGEIGMSGVVGGGSGGCSIAGVAPQSPDAALALMAIAAAGLVISRRRSR